ncbi:hypothetical protein Clacol_004902 [Clathrus columnatus]|uniref:Uncharacterized protein n=1 Tax=Clathrus columnatus TaxID=1419009 RepID=A0AAV5AFF0_9AGAM|nr:hypothetical protein Clacol_004902 [Clathrus columnatus]
MKKLWQIGLDRKKAVSGKKPRVSPESKEEGQLQSAFMKPPSIDSNELGSSVQAASQDLKNIHTITGKRLEHEDKPGHYDRVSKNVIGRLSIFNDLVQKFADKSQRKFKVTRPINRFYPVSQNKPKNALILSGAMLKNKTSVRMR